MGSITWKDIQIGMEMLDGSIVTQVHDIHMMNCINLTTKFESIIVSEDHLILCDLSKVSRRIRKRIFELSKINIAVEEDIIVDVENAENIKTIEDIENAFKNSDSRYAVATKMEPKIYDIKKNLVWLTALEIYQFAYMDLKIMDTNKQIIRAEFVGEKECFCISTTTGKYITKEKGFVSHNSVTIRNIILHCLTHGINIGLVDVKLTEFEQYKGCRNVIGVANNPAEAVELLRLMRQLMYTRNEQLAKAGVTDLVDYKPHKKTDRVAVFGREYKDSEVLTVRQNGEEKEITFSELVDILYQ